MEVTIHRCSGPAILPYLQDAARLRISVFREFPYLYEGAESYEIDYLSSYSQCPAAVFILAIVGGQVVGVSTGLPLADADESFQQPFLAAGENVAAWFYFGESVLAPEWRGRGIGHRFFDGREAHAAELGFARTTFCSVIRPPDHPLCPPGYHSHHAFWTGRGYRPDGRLVARLGWQQIDSAGEEVENDLVFWTRTAAG
jgi:GNAT superfamily N-acetyltransferase